MSDLRVFSGEVGFPSLASVPSARSTEAHVQGSYCLWWPHPLNWEAPRLPVCDPVDLSLAVRQGANTSSAMWGGSLWLRQAHPPPRSASRPQYWFVAVPHAVLIWVYDEVRKLFIRLYPGSK